MAEQNDSFTFNIDGNSGVPKFQQIVDSVVNGVSGGQLSPGDMLPSVNQIFYDTGLARATIVKALDELKRRGLIESVPNKGYFIAKETKRVLLLLDTLRPFKQVVYDALRQELPDKVEVNMYFHHYSIELMEDILLNAAGKYAAYVVMAYNHPDIKGILSKLDPNKLIVFDWMDPDWGDYSHVSQEFDQSLYNALEKAEDRIKKYNEFIFICPESANHPPESKNGFNRFCEASGIKSSIVDYPDQNIEGKAYLVVDDNQLIELVKVARAKGLKPGRDMGLIAFNDYPMKEVLEGGISVISPPFDEMARQMAQAINKREKICSLVLPELRLRNSL